MRTLRMILACAALAAGAAWAQEGNLRAGAARVDITPVEPGLPMAGYGGRTGGHQGVHDPIYVRAVVISDGERRAAIVSTEAIGIPEDSWSELSERLAREHGIPREYILLAATHTHGAPTTRANVKPEFAAPWKAWRARWHDGVSQAVRQAAGAMQPARMGAATGRAYVNTNRRARLAHGGWGLGVNPEGVSDKTVTVVRFDTAAGEPLAILIHYPVHGVVMGPRNYQVTGDLPGAAARFVEEHYGGRVVAAFLADASGDQNPIYGPGNDFSRVAALGRLLGEEAVRVAGSVRTSPHGRVAASQRVITCPGRRMTADSNTGQNRIAFEDAEPVDIRLSLLRVGKVAFAGVAGEVLTNIALRLRAESPYARTLLVSHSNGAVGYIPDDAAYEQVSYEIWVSRLKPGCAESGIVNGFLEMMDRH